MLEPRLNALKEVLSLPDVTGELFLGFSSSKSGQGGPVFSPELLRGLRIMACRSVWICIHQAEMKTEMSNSCGGEAQQRHAADAHLSNVFLCARRWCRALCRREIRLGHGTSPICRYLRLTLLEIVGREILWVLQWGDRYMSSNLTVQPCIKPGKPEEACSFGLYCCRCLDLHKFLAD